MSRILCPVCMKSVDASEIADVDGQKRCAACREMALRRTVPPVTPPAIPADPAPPPEEDFPREKTIPRQSFFRLIPGVFAYPAKGRGLLLLVMGTVFFWILNLLGSFSLFGLIFALLAGGYLSAYMIRVVSSSASGHEELPGWPEFTNLFDSVLVPFFLVTVINLTAFLPAILFWFFFRQDDATSAITLLALSILGLLYIPIGLLAVALYNTVTALNPLFLIPTIFRVPREYLTACVLFVAVAVLQAAGTYLAEFIPVAGSLLGAFASLYLLTIGMRIVGLLFFANEERLNWFREK